MAYTPADRFYRFTWDTSDVRGFGAVASGDLLLGTLPTTFRATRAGFAVTNGFNGVATLTAQLGWNSLRDNLTANKSVAWEATWYAGESEFNRPGLGLTPYLAASATTIPLYVQFASGGGNLNDTTGSSGIIWVEGTRVT